MASNISGSTLSATSTAADATALLTSNNWTAISGSSTLRATSVLAAIGIAWQPAASFTGTISSSTITATASTGVSTSLTAAIRIGTFGYGISGNITGSTITGTVTGSGFGGFGIVSEDSNAPKYVVLNATISGNTIKGKGDSTSAGIVAQLGSSGVIGASGSGNTISGTGYGIRLDGGSSNGSVVGNTIRNSDVNSGTAIGTGISFENGAAPTFTSNTITGNATGVLIDSSSCAVDTSGNTISGNTTTDINTIACQPQ